VFEGKQLSVELQLTENSVIGQILPPGAGELILLTPDAELARTEAEELGCFSFECTAAGPVRLRCRTSSAELVTDWFRL